MSRALLTAIFLVFLIPAGAAAGSRFELPPMQPAEEFGTSLIDRLSTSRGVKPVLFSHWVHRRKYTCAVCHSELEFNMLVNSTEITEKANRSGRYCGECHNGQISFPIDGHCDRCHTGTKSSEREKFRLFSKKAFPTTLYGNGIDWVLALRRGLVEPATFLRRESQDMPFDKTLILESEWGRIPPAIFPHKAHTDWMDCNTCHPEVFNIKKKTTEHFRMMAILRGEFCGACHLNVAFPMDDCARCHPGIRE